MRKQVLIRGVEDEVYRHAKAVAVLRGLPMGSAVSEALKMWVEKEGGGDREREYRDDLDFVRSQWKRLKKHTGKAVVVSSGRLQGVFDKYEEACDYSSRFKVALAFVVEDSPTERDIEFGPELEVQR
jgi:hypothetical protein